MKTTQQNLSRPAGRHARSWRGWFILHSAFILLPCVVLAATNDLSGLLQKGLFEEEANRNLDAAVQAYQSLVTAFDRDRKMAATAVFRLGECYRKLGQTNEAIRQYERIVREFADEPTLATLSRQNLAGMGISLQSKTQSAPANFSFSTVGRSPSSELEQELVLLKAQIEQARRETNEYALFEFLGDTNLLNVLRVRDSERLDLAAAKNRDPSEAGNGFKVPIPVLERRVKDREAQLQEEFNRWLATQNLRVRVLESAIAQARGLSATNALASSAASVVVDDEEEEIHRLQAMIKDSPDLLNAPGDDKLTPLCRAASKGQLRVAQFLVGKGDSLEQRASGRTPLHHAAANGHKAMVEFLLARGVDVNARDTTVRVYRSPTDQTVDLRTALHMAAEKGFLAVAEALLAGKADVNARNSDQATPLHLAVEKGFPAMVAFLISKGADVNAQDRAGRTPLDWAKPEIAALLRQHGAEKGSPMREPVPPVLPVPPVVNDANVASRIYVSGEVRSPGALTLQPGQKITVAKAIVRAGDCTDLANKKKVKVQRAWWAGDGGKKQEFEVNLTDILERGKTEQDIVLEAGDMVVVPRKVF